MSTLAEIEAAVEKLPPRQQQELLLFLTVRLHGCTVQMPRASSATQSVLEISPVSVGKVLLPASSDDDLLGEMLEGRL